MGQREARPGLTRVAPSRTKSDQVKASRTKKGGNFVKRRAAFDGCASWVFGGRRADKLKLGLQRGGSGLVQRRFCGLVKA